MQVTDRLEQYEALLEIRQRGAARNGLFVLVLTLGFGAVTYALWQLPNESTSDIVMDATNVIMLSFFWALSLRQYWTFEMLKGRRELIAELRAWLDDRSDR